MLDIVTVAIDMQLCNIKTRYLPPVPSAGSGCRTVECHVVPRLAATSFNVNNFETTVTAVLTAYTYLSVLLFELPQRIAVTHQPVFLAFRTL